MKKKNKIALTVIIMLVVFLPSGILQRNYAVPIVMYHSIRPNAPPGDRLAVSPETFEKQMRFLKENNYRVVTLGELARMLKLKKKIPARTIALTFDDGYKDNFTYAFPILKKYGLPATVFVIVQEIGRPQNDRLSWSQIEEMALSGLIEIGSHTIGPEPLINIKSDEELRRQISDSRKLLEAKLQRPVRTFSYPEGRFNDKIKNMVIEAGYESAVATNPGKKFSNRDIFALKRIRISENSRNMFVFWVETSGYYNFMREHRHK